MERRDSLGMDEIKANTECLKKVNKNIDVRSRNDRRRRADFVIRAVNVIAAIGWVSLAIGSVVFVLAAPWVERLLPEGETWFFTNRWNAGMLKISYSLLLVSLISGATGLFFNAMRTQRKTDRYSRPLIVLCIASVIFIALFIAYFMGYMFF